MGSRGSRNRWYVSGVREDCGENWKRKTQNETQKVNKPNPEVLGGVLADSVPIGEYAITEPRLQFPEGSCSRWEVRRSCTGSGLIE